MMLACLIEIILSGKVGIVTNDPTGILQVGLGLSRQRLRRSNGTTDYSIIGTLDTLCSNDTNITLSGYQGSVQAGNIEYEAVNQHVFCTTNTGPYLLIQAYILRIPAWTLWH